MDERGGAGSAYILDATAEGLAVAGLAARVAEEEEGPTVIQVEEVLLSRHQLAVAMRGGRQDGGHQRSLPVAGQALEVQPLGVWRGGSRDIAIGWGTKCHTPRLPWQWRGLTVEEYCSTVVCTLQPGGCCCFSYAMPSLPSTGGRSTN